MSARAESLMGTTVAIEAVGAGHEAAIERAFAWFRVVEDTCTRFNPQSELCQLSLRAGSAVPVSQLLFEAIRFALSVAAASDGAFDPTIGASLHQRGFNREHRSGQPIGPVAILEGTRSSNFPVVITVTQTCSWYRQGLV